jgi:hypothetical protein
VSPGPVAVASTWAAAVLVFPTAGVAVIGCLATTAAAAASAAKRGRDRA